MSIDGSSGDEDDETIRVPIHVSVTATDPDDDLERVAYLIQSPFAGRPPLGEGELVSTGGSSFARDVDISISAGETGVYSILVYAVDASGALSDEVRGMLTVGGTGEPPVLVSVSAPDTISRPPPGDPPTLLLVTATVTDPDGLGNINEVTFWNVSNPNTRFPMFDDGRFDESGDETADDGVYSAVVSIESTNEPATNTLAFQASDRSGLVSNVIEKVVVVE